MTTFDIQEGRSRSLLRKPLVSSGGAVGGGVGPYESRFSFARPFAEFVCGVGVIEYFEEQRVGNQEVGATGRPYGQIMEDGDG